MTRLMRRLGTAALSLCLPQLALAQAAPQDAPRSQCTYLEIARLPLRYAGLSLEPAVAGVIDGVPAVMLVDTGADAMYLTMTATLRRDLPLRTTMSQVEGVGGRSRVYTARLKDFAIGPISSPGRKELPVIASMGSTPGYDAVAGAPFLLQADLEFDLRAKQIKFFRGKDCEKTPLNYWEEAAVELPFERSAGYSPNPHFKVLVNGKALDAIIDTGAQVSVMRLDAARRIGIDVGAADARRVGDTLGVGARRVPRWSVPVSSVQLGDETIGNVRLGVIDTRAELDAELYLGQDFLRSHRVLFAMSQEKLYIAYLGGEIFPASSAIPQWIVEEAEAGNADAQFRLANTYLHGSGVPRDLAKYRAWRDKAAAQQHPHAQLLLGRHDMIDGKVTEAIALLRTALAQMPDERIAPLWLYNARVRNGEAELAARELETAFGKQDYDDWPAPLVRFYLGQGNPAQVLEEAGKAPGPAYNNTCHAATLLAEWYEARGDKAQAEPFTKRLREQCAAGPAAAGGGAG